LVTWPKLGAIKRRSLILEVTLALDVSAAEDWYFITTTSTTDVMITFF
jgi:hypothetical protein